MFGPGPLVNLAGGDLLNRKEIVGVSVLMIAVFVSGGALAAGALQSLPVSTNTQTTAIDEEILNVPRDNGIFLSLAPANFTAAFAFAPLRGFVQVNAVYLTLNWNQNSLGHVGDMFTIRLNGGGPSFITMQAFATKVAAIPSQQLRVGANQINIGLIPVNPSATQSTDSYLLYEVRLTVDYTFIG